MIKLKLLFLFTLVFCMSIDAHGQVLEGAYCEWDDQFDEWKLHINEEEYVMAVRQFGANAYRRWSFKFENLEGEYFTGYMQLKRADDLNYWDFEFDNERLSITTIYRNDFFTWKVQHDDKHFTFVAKDRFGISWADRFEKEFEWTMYQVEEGDPRDWYIDDDSGVLLTYPIRIAAAMIVVEMNSFEFRR